MKTKRLLTQIEAIKSVRVTWGFSPVTRRVASKKTFQRKPKYHKGWE